MRRANKFNGEFVTRKKKRKMYPFHSVLPNKIRASAILEKAPFYLIKLAFRDGNFY